MLWSKMCHRRHALLRLWYTTIGIIELAIYYLLALGYLSFRFELSLTSERLNTRMLCLMKRESKWHCRVLKMPDEQNIWWTNIEAITNACQNTHAYYFILNIISSRTYLYHLVTTWWVFILVGDPKALARPKSPIFNIPSLFISKLLGFKSLCNIQFWCKYSKPKIKQQLLKIWF